MPGLTPLLGTSYPLGTDPPYGHTQIETVAKAIEKATVVPVASTADRNSKFIAGVVREGSVCFITASKKFQVYTGGAWEDVWTFGDRAYQVGGSLPSASGNPGLIFLRTSDDALFFSDGQGWIRVTDNTDSRNAKDAFEGTNVSTNSTSGVRGGTSISVDVVVPDSGKFVVTCSARIQATGSSLGLFGHEIVVIGGATLVPFSAARAAASGGSGGGSANWTSISDVNTSRAGQTLRVYGIIASSQGSDTQTFTQRQIVVQPVR